MPELNIDVNYREHIKVRRLIARIGPLADVYPVRLWCYTAQHYPADGKLVGHTIEDIESVCGWDGASGELVRAMIEFRLIDLKKLVYSIHNWKSREGHLLSFSIRASKAAEARWKKARGDATSMPKQCLTDAPTNQPTILTNQPTPSMVDGSAEGGETNGHAAITPDLVTLLDVTGLGPNCSPKHRAQAQRLIDTYGVSEVRRGVDMAMANEVGGVGALAYAETVLSRDRARKNLRAQHVEAPQVKYGRRPS